MNAKRMRASFLLAAALLLLSACGGEKYEPVAVDEETDKCAACNMQVKDDGNAAQLITGDGKVYKFDDIGCMHEWTAQNGTENVAVRFVRDHNTLEWVKLEDAFFVYDPSFRTPMAYGVIAFKDEESARQYVEEKGKGVVMDPAELARHTWERHRNPMDPHSPAHGRPEGEEHAENVHPEGQA